jgi:hypothetical protein
MQELVIADILSSITSETKRVASTRPTLSSLVSTRCSVIACFNNRVPHNTSPIGIWIRACTTPTWHWYRYIAFGSFCFGENRSRSQIVCVPANRIAHQLPHHAGHLLMQALPIGGKFITFIMFLHYPSCNSLDKHVVSRDFHLLIAERFDSSVRSIVFS